MSRLEDILWEAEKLGIRREVLSRVGEIKQKTPKIRIEEAYDVAFSEVLKESNEKKK